MLYPTSLVGKSIEIMYDTNPSEADLCIYSVHCPLLPLQNSI